MNLKLLSLACLATLAIAGCKPQPPAEPTEAAPAKAATDVVETTPIGVSSADAPAFDQKAFAGTFSGTLPCASCPGIDTQLELAADGTFQLDETYQDQKDGNFKLDGTWTSEDNGKLVRLDPNSKSEEDRLYEIVSPAEIRMLGKDGKAPTSTLSYALKRDAAAK